MESRHSFSSYDHCDTDSYDHCDTDSSSWYDVGDDSSFRGTSESTNDESSRDVSEFTYAQAVLFNTETTQGKNRTRSQQDKYNPRQPPSRGKQRQPTPRGKQRQPKQRLPIASYTALAHKHPVGKRNCDQDNRYLGQNGHTSRRISSNCGMMRNAALGRVSSGSTYLEGVGYVMMLSELEVMANRNELGLWNLSPELLHPMRRYRERKMNSLDSKKQWAIVPRLLEELSIGKALQSAHMHKSMDNRPRNMQCVTYKLPVVGYYIVEGVHEHDPYKRPHHDDVFELVQGLGKVSTVTTGAVARFHFEGESYLDEEGHLARPKQHLRLVSSHEMDEARAKKVGLREPLPGHDTPPHMLYGCTRYGVGSSEYLRNATFSGAWTVRDSFFDQSRCFMEFDFGKNFDVTHISTHGGGVPITHFPDARIRQYRGPRFNVLKPGSPAQYVEMYEVDYRMDGSHTWSSSSRTFKGNTNSTDTEYRSVGAPIRCRYLRIRPISHHGTYISMGASVYGYGVKEPKQKRLKKQEGHNDKEVGHVEFSVITNPVNSRSRYGFNLGRYKSDWAYDETRTKARKRCDLTRDIQEGLDEFYGVC